MVLPDGTVVRPQDPPYEALILLHPGETLFVSTRERLHVLLDLVGNMSITGGLSRDGVLSLTGLIVDPGYKDGPSGDGRLMVACTSASRTSVRVRFPSSRGPRASSRSSS